MKYRLMLFASLLIYTCNAYAADVSIQAENFINYNNISGLNIQESGNLLFGLDVAGEWTGYNYSISSFGTRSAVMYARGTDGINYHLRLTLTPTGGGEQVTVDFQFTGSRCG